MASRVLDSLLVELGFEYDSKELKTFKKDLTEVSATLKDYAKKAAAAAAAVTGLVVATAVATDEQGKLAGRLGETVETLTAWEFAAQIAGSTANSMRSSFLALSKSAGEAARGVGGGIEAFGILGVEVLEANGKIKDTSKLMMEVSKAIQGLSKQQQIDLSDKLGLSDSLLLLQLGPERIAELTTEAKLLGVTTAKDAIIAADFNDSLVRMWSIAKSLSRTLTASLAPSMTKTAEKVADWWKANQEIIKQNLPEWMDKLKIALRLTTVALVALIPFIATASIIKFIALVKVLTASMIALATSTAIIPVVVAGAFAALVLLLEDAQKFFKGQDSLIGALIKKYPELADEIMLVANSLKFMLDTAKAVDKFFSKDKKGISQAGRAGSAALLGGASTLLTPVAKLQGLFEDSTLPVAAPGEANKIVNIKIDGVDIVVPPGANPIEIVAEQLMNNLEQASTDLNKGVDQ